MIWILFGIIFAILGYLYRKVELTMSANKDELSRFKNSFNDAIDKVEKKIEDLKSGQDVITPADIQAAFKEPLERLETLGKPPDVEPPVDEEPPSDEEPPVPNVEPKPPEPPEVSGSAKGDKR